jgi:hypothetical protein
MAAAIAPPPEAGVPALPATPPQFTASAALRFTRPAEASMPAFMDALHDAGIDQLTRHQRADSQPVGRRGRPVRHRPRGLSDIDQAILDKAANAAVTAARAQAEVLAAAGRHVGQVRQSLMLGKSVQGDKAVVGMIAKESRPCLVMTTGSRLALSLRVPNACRNSLAATRVVSMANLRFT